MKRRAVNYQEITPLEQIRKDAVKAEDIPNIPPRREELIKNDSGSIISVNSLDATPKIISRHTISSRPKSHYQEEIGYPKRNTNFLATPKRLIPGEHFRNHTIITDDPLEEFIASSTGLKRSQTLKDVRKHVRDRTRNLDDAASVDSGKSKDEAVSKIRNVLSELDQLKKRNEELEAMLKGTKPFESKNDENETWKEIENITIQLLEKLGQTPATIEDLQKDILSNQPAHSLIEETSNSEPLSKLIAEPLSKQIVSLPPITQRVETKRGNPSISLPLSLPTTAPVDDATFKNDLLAMMNGFGF